LDAIALRKDGVSWREIAAETAIAKDTARRVGDKKKRSLAEKREHPDLRFDPHNVYDCKRCKD